MKKVLASLLIGVLLTLSIGTACFASGPDFEVSWSGGVDCGVVAVGGAVATGYTYTEFSSQGKALYGLFAAGEDSNFMVAKAYDGNVKYLSAIGDDETGAIVKLSAAAEGDCADPGKAKMIVGTCFDCTSYMDSEYCVTANGCEFEVEMMSATYDCSDMNVIAAYSSGDAGKASIIGGVGMYGQVGAYVSTDANGKGEFAVAAASNNIAVVDGVCVDSGSITLVAEYADGIDAGLFIFAGEGGPY